MRSTALSTERQNRQGPCRTRLRGPTTHLRGRHHGNPIRHLHGHYFCYYTAVVHDLRRSFPSSFTQFCQVVHEYDCCVLKIVARGIGGRSSYAPPGPCLEVMACWALWASSLLDRCSGLQVTFQADRTQSHFIGFPRLARISMPYIYPLCAGRTADDQ